MLTNCLPIPDPLLPHVPRTRWHRTCNEGDRYPYPRAVSVYCGQIQKGTSGMSTTRMKASDKKATNGTDGKEATPVMHQRGHAIQKFGTVTAMPVGVSEQARQENC